MKTFVKRHKRNTPKGPVIVNEHTRNLHGPTQLNATHFDPTSGVVYETPERVSLSSSASLKIEKQQRKAEKKRINNAKRDAAAKQRALKRLQRAKSKEFKLKRRKERIERNLVKKKIRIEKAQAKAQAVGAVYSPRNELN